MTRRTIALLSITLAFLIMSCEEATHWDLDIQDDGRLVVDAILTNEMKRQEIRLTRSSEARDVIIQPAADAVVSLSSTGGQIAFNPSMSDPGIYRSEISFAAKKDVPYTLDIIWQDMTYTAQGELSFVAPLEEIRFDRSLGNDSLSIHQVGPIYHPLSQAMYEVKIDWRHINPSPVNQAKLFFYSFSSVDANELIRPTKEKVYFPQGSIIVEKKFGLDPAFANYLRALALETEWQGGLFDDASNSLPSNISNDGLGFFSICAVLADTIIAR